MPEPRDPGHAREQYEQRPLDATIRLFFEGPIPPGEGDRSIVWVAGNTGLGLAAEWIDHGRVLTWKLYFGPDAEVSMATNDADRERYRAAFTIGMNQLLRWIKQERTDATRKQAEIDRLTMRQYEQSTIRVLPGNIVCHTPTNLRMFKFMQNLLGERYIYNAPYGPPGGEQQLVPHYDLEGMAQDKALLDKLDQLSQGYAQQNYVMKELISQ